MTTIKKLKEFLNTLINDEAVVKIINTREEKPFFDDLDLDDIDFIKLNKEKILLLGR